jgi:hypothetical protein
MLRHTGGLPGMSSMMMGDVDAHVERMVITPKDWLITIAKRRPL